MHTSLDSQQPTQRRPKQTGWERTAVFRCGHITATDTVSWAQHSDACLSQTDTFTYQHQLLVTSRLHHNGHRLGPHMQGLLPLDCCCCCIGLFQGKSGLEARTAQADIKTKQAAVNDQQPIAQPAAQPAQQSAQPTQPSTDPLQADTPAVQPLQQAAGWFRPGPKGAAQAFAARGAGQAAAVGGAAGSNAFGALMSAAKNKKATSSDSTKLSSQEMRQQADK